MVWFLYWNDSLNSVASVTSYLLIPQKGILFLIFSKSNQFQSSPEIFQRPTIYKILVIFRNITRTQCPKITSVLSYSYEYLQIT
jgi:uncharacterized membrane protein